MINFKIKISDIIICFKSDSAKLSYPAAGCMLESDFGVFAYNGCRAADILLRIEYGLLAKPQRGKLIFDMDKNWRLFRHGNKILIEYFYRRSLRTIDRFIEFDDNLTRGVITVNQEVAFIKKKSAEERGRYVINASKKDFLQHLIIWHLAGRYRGLLGHGAFIKDKGRGFLFIGKSESGKTTMARLYSIDQDAEIYNDDRAIIRFNRKNAYFYNVPWHGDYFSGNSEFLSGDKIRIDKIFFISHAKINIGRRISGIEAAYKIFHNAFLPFWDKEGLCNTLDVCKKLVKNVPCYKLGFVNKKSIVEYIRKMD